MSATLNSITTEIWEELSSLNATLSVSHISGSLNVLADRLSRPGQVLQGEWELCQDTFNHLTRVWGCPDVDLFATRFNRKLRRFVSLCPDADAISIDAMNTDWSQFRFPYLFPPFGLILECLERIKGSHTTCLIVTPAWTGNAFFPLLSELAIDDPVFLGANANLLEQGFEPQVKAYHDVGSLGLHAWLVSSGRSSSAGFPLTSRHCRPNHNETRQSRCTPSYGDDSPLGFKVSGEQILSRLLPRE